jgi:hypothetical protein
MLNGRGHSIATEPYARLKIYNSLSIKKMAESMKSLENPYHFDFFATAVSPCNSSEFQLLHHTTTEYCARET